MSKEKEAKQKENPAKDVSVSSLPTKTTRQDDKGKYINRIKDRSNGGR